MIAEKLNVMVIGSGGREHTLVKSCLASPIVANVIAAPGNAGIAAEVTCLAIPVTDNAALVKAAVENKINFAIVGPEIPLCNGLSDELRKTGIPVYGPDRRGAEFEGSKAFTKDFLQKYSIPTAASATFKSDQLDAALKYLKSAHYPLVIKASGLAAGKGVIIEQSPQTAIQTATEMLTGKAFGESGKTILVEEFLEGEETSIMLMVSGKKYVALPASQDHKRVGEKDTGLNTGGMGAYAPASVVTPELDQIIREAIIEPSLSGIESEGIDYRGTLYIGVMLTANGPKVLEYNVRFGDPETQVLLPLLESDPVQLMWECATGTLNPSNVRIRDAYAAVIVVAAKGYPESFPKGESIRLPKELPTDTWIVHAGTRAGENDFFLSDGGRVLGVTALAKTLKEATQKAYAVCDQIEWSGKYFRRDIGWRQLARDDTQHS
jgi:phosphoribosylamine--glycine ligase